MKLNRKNGFSLIEILIAAGLAAMLSLGLASMFLQQQKEMKALDEKFYLQSLRQNVMNILQSKAVCLSNLGTISADISSATTTTPSTINFVFNELHIGTSTLTPLVAKVNVSLPGRLSNEMIPASMQMKNIYQTGAVNEYRGTLVIDFLSSSMTRALKSLEFDLFFTITPPATNAFISNCGPKTDVLTISCIDLSATCLTLTTVVSNCSSPALPAGYVLVGGSCVSASNEGKGRLLLGSSPNASGTHWVCADRDAGSQNQSGRITVSAHACISSTALANLECLQSSTSALHPGIGISTTYSPFAPAGYELLGGGCADSGSSPPVHFLLTSAPSAAGDRWLCEGRDVSAPTAGGSMTSTGIFCRATPGSTAALSCKKNSVTVPNMESSMTFANATAAPGSAITSAGCSAQGFTPSWAGRFMTALQANTPSSAICLNKDHIVAAGGQTTATTISCGF